jgi:hypothetical protein
MTSSSPALKGIIHGKLIELDREPGLPDGQQVVVTLEPVTASRPQWEEAWAQVKDLPPGEGLRRAFGAWAEDAEEVDKFLEWSRAQRKVERRPLDL